MKAIILAAGRGSRMGELTKDFPKCLSILKGLPLIEHQIKALSNAGLKEIAIVTGYKSEYLKKYGSKHFYNSKWAETNILYSLLCAREWLNEDDCIISYADIFYESQIVKDLSIVKDEIAIASDPNWLKLWSMRFKNPLDDAETFRIDDNDYLLEIGQKSHSINEIQGQYMGLLKFKKGFFNKYESRQFEKSDMTSFLNRLLIDGKRIKVIHNRSVWGECDTETDLKIMCDL